MMIWKWPLFQTILHGYPMRKRLLAYNESHTLNVDDVGIIGLKKKQYYFYKKKQNVRDFKGSISRVEKLFSEEFVQNVSAYMCCRMKCCQHCLQEKTMLLKQKSWSFSFKNYKVYGLDIPRRLHTRINMKCRILIIIQAIEKFAKYLVPNHWCVYINIYVVQIK